ncbi:hypothetical protein E5D57_000363 [Metarhizium anisopliae]|nr:hypothetical protein E5D57_000363 [Metarhizium anisopliae]
MELANLQSSNTQWCNLQGAPPTEKTKKRRDEIHSDIVTTVDSNGSQETTSSSFGLPQEPEYRQTA